MDAERIAAWNSNHLPIYEPGLPDVVFPARDGIPNGRRPNLFFSTNIDKAIVEADLIFVSVNTPTKAIGSGAGQASNLSYVESAIRKIAEVAEDDKIIVEKSTVPARTAETVRDILEAIGRPGLHFDVLSNPEFLAEGTAMSDLLQPDRILIGSLTTESGLRAAAALAEIYSWVPPERVITMNLWSSEMAKLAANALLAQRISSINALSAICEATGADIDEVSYACGLDTRIGPRMLKASVGFGGSCFQKDVLSLAYIAETLHLPEVAAYWRSVVDINEYQKDRFTRRVLSCLYGNLADKRLAILGFAYKKNTGDTRGSAAITVINSLVNEGARVRIYDPQVEEEQIWKELLQVSNSPENVRRNVKVCCTAYEACTGAHAAIILTEWDEFSNKTSARPSPLALGTRFASYGQIQPRSISTALLSSCPLKGNVRLAGLQVNNGLLIRRESPCLTPESDLDRCGYADAADGIVYAGNGPSSTEQEDDMDSNPSDVSSACNSQANDGTYSPPESLTTEISKGQNRIDWRLIADLMTRPMFVFDGRNVVDPGKLGELGFRVECIGKAGYRPSGSGMSTPRNFSTEPSPRGSRSASRGPC